MSAKLTFVYWPVQGLGAVPRMALHFAKADFEDKLIVDHAKWFGPDTEAVAAKNALVNLPYLETEEDGLIVQSNAILRYIANKFNLGGKTLAEQAKVDQVNEHLVDLRKEIFSQLVFCEKEKFEENKKKFVEETLTYFFAGFEKWIVDGKKEFVAGDEITVADLHLAQIVAQISECYGDAGETFAAYPNVLKIYKAVTGHENLKSFYASPMGKAAFHAPHANYSPLVLPGGDEKAE